jgi:Protein of unknown function (DUF3302)
VVLGSIACIRFHPRDAAGQQVGQRCEGIGSLLILAVLIVGALFLVLIVAAIPGQLAKNRHSPWVEAINVAG